MYKQKRMVIPFTLISLYGCWLELPTISSTVTKCRGLELASYIAFKYSAYMTKYD